MAIGWIIRRAAIDDAEAISRVIVQAVERTNSKDYPPAIIAEVIGNFSPERVIERLLTRQVFAVTEQEMVVGTGSLDGTMVRSVFVLPRFQRRGVGRALLGHIEGV